MSMMLLSLSLLALVNFFLLMWGFFYPEEGYKNGILMFNGLSYLFLMGVILRQPSKKISSQLPPSSPEANTTPSGREDLLLVLSQLPNFLCLKDQDGRWLKASRSYLSSFNIQHSAYQGLTNDDLSLLPESNLRALKLCSIQDKSALHLKQTLKETKVITVAGQKPVTFEITRTPIFKAPLQRPLLLVTGQLLEQVNTSAVEQLMQWLEHAHLNLILLDSTFTIVAINQSFSQLTGYQFADLTQQELTFCLVGDLGLSHQQFIHATNDIFWSKELLCRHKQGQLFPVKLDISELRKHEGQYVYFATLTDITRQKQSEKQMMQVAHNDKLTGLPNRALFFANLTDALLTTKANAKWLVVLCINLDRFKSINDSLGHEGGNVLLKEVAFRLRSFVTQNRVIARLSSDEFGVFITNESTHEQAIYATTLLAGEILHNLANAFLIYKQEVFITASIGIALSSDHGDTAELLIKHADIAMYEAKRQGRNNYQFYKQEHANAAHDRLVMETNLRKAIEKNELQLYYQPQYYAATGKIFGAEVLVRWFHGPELHSKMILPDQFIPIAEESGLIVEMGAWIMRTACYQLKKWLDEGYELKQVSVNVSARQFADNEFIPTVQKVLQETQLNPAHLELELTESLLVGDIKQIELQLQRLKKMGIKIALDDFGTGYSSLSYLKNLPIDVLKIDRSFIKEMTIESKDARLTAAIIEMGHSLGQIIIAEGVETEQQLIYLTQHGCDIIQGYYFSPPLPIYKMSALLMTEFKSSLIIKDSLKTPENNIFNLDY